ncbi:GAF domain-containing protein [Halostella sp. JP-L12]|uniref:MEDS domain-containing protein n=1 Tax=Halostella TaxID=1843185 RepID=UPI000EF797DB|nr:MULTISPECIES: MEDS domain-containing protein [Halostella]NHN47071.1 GAF domain-containing protein [Halostella sp. JP-L12]
MSQRTIPTDRSDVLNLDSGLEALDASDEFHGSVECLDGDHCNDHFAMIYESREEQFEAVVPFVRQGLEDGERCLFVVDETPEPVVKAALRDAGVDVDDAVDSGALSFHGVGETYLRNGEFDPDEMIDFYDGAIDDATAGYNALRVVADTGWILDETTDTEKFMAYESRVNDLFRGEDCIALCQYDRDLTPPDVLRDVIETHPHLIYDGTACHNFYYTPPEEFFGPDAPDNEIDRMMGTLVDRTEARTALQQRERDFRELYETTSDPDLDFEGKLARLLELGRERFDLGIGFLAHVDGDAFRVIDAVGDHERIQPGDTAPLSETYCRQLIDSAEPMGVTDAPAEGWEDDPAYGIYGLDSYVGTTVTAGAETYGTLCFADRSRRNEPFTDAEYTFLELMGQWLSYELDREERERYLREQNEITASPDMGFEEKLQQLFDLGCERFGLEFGGMARVDPDADAFEIEHVSGDHEHFEPGFELPLSETYCTAPIESGRATGVADPEGYEDVTVYREFGLQSYLGTHVEVDGGDDRTFFFVSSERRDAPFTEEELTYQRLLGQWVKYELERERRERRLATLNDASRDLMAAESATEVTDCVVDAADGLQMPITAAALWDEQDGSLRPAGRTDAAEALDGVAPFAAGDGIGWRAFVENESLRETAPTGEGGAITDVVAHPIGSQGVVVTGTTEPNGFRSAELEFAQTVAANTSAAVCRAERERQLHDRESTLAEQKESLERLRRINDTIRDIQQALVSASSRAEIAEVVCRHLADVGPYDLAWIGDHDRASGEVRPNEWAGTEKGFLDEVDVTTGGDGDDRSPTAAAVESRETVVVNRLLDDPPFDPWRQAALSRGYHAAIALPLGHEDSRFGVLTVYASESGVFDDLERAVLSELSDTVAYAVNAVESKKALVNDEVTELTFEIAEEEFPIVRVVRETDCEFTYENVVLRADGGLRMFFCTRGAAAADVEAFASELPITGLELLSEREVDGETVCRFEVALSDESVTATVLDHGGRIGDVRLDDDAASVRVDLAAAAETREFVEMFASKFPSSELVAKHTRERPQRTLGRFRAELTEDLTDRQLETLQTAYCSGYFEKPRLRTGSEVAASMDISQPTFNNHLRAAQRKVCDELFEAEN